MCNACHRGVVGQARAHTPIQKTDLVNQPGALVESSVLTLKGWLPTSPAPDVPGHLPEVCEQAFMEAEQLRLSGFRTASGNAYRRALESGLKYVAPDLKGTLFSRIEQLTKNGELVASMRDFAHRIRTLGNEASHETPVVDDDEIDDLAVFTRLFLMYQFTLPGMLPSADPGPA